MPPRFGNGFMGKLFGGAAAGAVAVPEIVAGSLGLVGFTPLGPAAGSIAAAVQSSIGCVAAGSPFAIAQSIAMGGLAAPLAATGAAIGVAVVLGSAVLGGNEPDPDSEHENEHENEGEELK